MSAAAAVFQQAGLGSLAEGIKAWLSVDANASRTHEEFAQFLGDMHLNTLTGRKEQALVRRAQLPATGRVSDVLPWMRKRGLCPRQLNTLADSAWLVEGKHVVVTGAHGTGKTALAAALAREALARKRTVRYERLPDLLADLRMAGDEKALGKALRALSRPHLLVLDDFTEERTPTEACQLLRRLVDGRHRVGRSVLVVASAPPEDWDGFFLDPTARSSIFSRLLPKAIALDLNG